MTIKILILLCLISFSSPGCSASAFETRALWKVSNPFLKFHSEKPISTISAKLPNSRAAFSIERARQKTATDTARSSQAIESTIPNYSAILKKSYGQTRSRFNDLFVSFYRKLNLIVKHYWWSFPMMLIAIPIYSKLFLGTSASMPTWWPLTSMDHVHRSPRASFVLTTFLSSNICYLISGLYLLMARPLRHIKGFSPLGGLVIGSGVVSTVFHYFQALGSFCIAEALCYVDHGVAISSILYFLHRCGRPGVITSILSTAGLVTLNMTGPGYAFLHSLWHLLSASAAIFWAHDGMKRYAENK